MKKHLFLHCVILAYLSAFTIQKTRAEASTANIFQTVQTEVTMPRLVAILDDSGSPEITQPIVDRLTKYAMPPAVQNYMQENKVSIFYAQKKDSSITGNILFPKHAQLAKEFDACVALFERNPDAIALCRKLHFNALNMLYFHLMKLYANVNVQHAGTKEVGKQVVVDVKEYKKQESLYGINKKTLCINMLVMLVEEQFNASLRLLIPDMQKSHATIMARGFSQSDYSVDLTTILDKKDNENILHAAATYFSFMKKYTETLLSGVSFARHIQTIDMHAAPEPFLFYVGPYSMRSIEMVPSLSRSFMGTKPFGFPEHIVKAAQNETMVEAKEKTPFVQKHPIAFFKDKQGNITNKITQASTLFMTVMEGQNLFQQELLVQQEWMKSLQGIYEIQAGCFGDIFALIHKNVLDQWTEKVMQNLLSRVK